jgi:hypothetical protein
METRQSKASYQSPETVAAVGCVVFAGKESWRGLEELKCSVAAWISHRRGSINRGPVAGIMGEYREYPLN